LVSALDRVAIDEEPSLFASTALHDCGSQPLGFWPRARIVDAVVGLLPFVAERDGYCKVMDV
jgi:hypothetical protein